MSSSRTVDIHCHLSTPATRDLAAAHFESEYEPYDYFMGEDSKQRNAEMIPTIAAPLTQPEARLADMDRMRIEVQGLATFVSEYFYWVPGELGAELARMQNDRLTEAAAAYPDRFALLGATVPLQDIDAAITEAARAKDIGFKGLQIGGTVNGRNLDGAEFPPLLRGRP